MLFFEIEIYDNRIAWKSNLLQQPEDISVEGFFYKSLIEETRIMTPELGGQVQIKFKTEKPSFMLSYNYITSITDKTQNPEVVYTNIQSNQELYNIFKQLG